MEDEKEIFKTNPATAERQKYNELISALTPILTKIESASSLNKNNFSRNAREINNGLRMVSHDISVDSLRSVLPPKVTQLLGSDSTSPAKSTKKLPVSN